MVSVIEPWVRSALVFRFRLTLQLSNTNAIDETNMTTPCNFSISCDMRAVRLMQNVRNSQILMKGGLTRMTRTSVCDEEIDDETDDELMTKLMRKLMRKNEG